MKDPKCGPDKKNEHGGKDKMEIPEEEFLCPYCLSRKHPIEVHGHFQCVDCKMNVDPCCAGAPTDDHG